MLVLRPRPQHDVLAGIRVEQVPPPLAVAVPQLAPQDHPPQRAPQDPLEHDAARVVQPQVRVRVQQVADAAAVVAVHHPPAMAVLVLVEDGLDLHTELVERSILPACAVVEGVQLHMRQLQPGCEPPREVGLARAADPDDADPLHSTHDAVATVPLGTQRDGMSVAPAPAVSLQSRFAGELPELAVSWRGEPAPDPRVLVLNEPLAVELGVDPAWLRSPDGLRLLVGDLVPDGAVRPGPRRRT